MKKYRCIPCDYIYDPALGDPDNGINPGTAFEDLPDNVFFIAKVVIQIARTDAEFGRNQRGGHIGLAEAVEQLERHLEDAFGRAARFLRGHGSQSSTKSGPCRRCIQSAQCPRCPFRACRRPSSARAAACERWTMWASTSSAASSSGCSARTAPARPR
mgnify:CR=1 FL=1